MILNAGVLLTGASAVLAIAWMALDQLYVSQAWFRRAWAKTRLPFPHTAFSPYFKRRR